MRLFVALELPADVRVALAGWAATAAPAAMRRVPEDNLHVTLAFLGEQAPEDATTVAALLGELARPVGQLAVGSPLWLPPRRPGVLAVALEAGPALAELHAGLVAALAETIGFEPERRALRPHVTVARARRDTRLRATAPDPPPPALTFEPEGLVLYRSHTGPGGARYEPLARVGA
ncbi:MAG TPA: RNA 2',3'-cyclic phosphodiesterase [Solirubrobacteraceae bacterium]|jgi:2'-5' RNA ligase|nr:RNA 2',3'-cyclic phosphodiesterase [Solirubrobacteraceae bacterium]